MNSIHVEDSRFSSPGPKAWIFDTEFPETVQSMLSFALHDCIVSSEGSAMLSFHAAFTITTPTKPWHPRQ